MTQDRSKPLALALGTSPMPVREAIKQLCAQHVLELMPNRVFRVPPLSSDRITEVFEARLALEGVAAERAAQVMTPRHIQRLEQLCSEMEMATVKRDIDWYLEQNYNFHFTFYEACASDIIVPTVKTLWLTVGPCIRLLFDDTGIAETPDEFHRRAIDALRRNDTAAAREAIEEDIEAARDFFLSSARLEEMTS